MVESIRYTAHDAISVGPVCDQNTTSHLDKLFEIGNSAARLAPVKGDTVPAAFGALTLIAKGAGLNERDVAAMGDAIAPDQKNQVVDPVDRAALIERFNRADTGLSPDDLQQLGALRGSNDRLPYREELNKSLRELNDRRPSQEELIELLPEPNVR